MLGEDCGQVSKLADEEQGHLDGDDNLDHSGSAVFYLDFRMGTLCRIPGSGSRRMYGTVSEGSCFQYGFDYWILLDDVGGAVCLVWRDLQNGIRHAEEKRSQAAEDAIDGCFGECDDWVDRSSSGYRNI